MAQPLGRCTCLWPSSEPRSTLGHSTRRARFRRSNDRASHVASWLAKLRVVSTSINCFSAQNCASVHSAVSAGWLVQSEPTSAQTFWKAHPTMQTLCACNIPFTKSFFAKTITSPRQASAKSRSLEEARFGANKETVEVPTLGTQRVPHRCFCD